MKIFLICISATIMLGFNELPIAIPVFTMFCWVHYGFYILIPKLPKLSFFMQLKYVRRFVYYFTASYLWWYLNGLELNRLYKTVEFTESFGYPFESSLFSALSIWAFMLWVSHSHHKGAV